MIKKKLKEAIKNYLYQYQNPDKTKKLPFSLYKKPDDLYLAINALLKDSHTIHKKDFFPCLNNFETDIKNGMGESASDSFINSLEKLSTPVPEIPTFQKGKKIGRRREWELFEHAYALLSNKTMLRLITGKLASKNKSDLLYIQLGFGTPRNDFPYVYETKEKNKNLNPETRERFKEMDSYVNSKIKYLGSLLGWIVAKAEENSPETKEGKNLRSWFVDIFGEEARHFLPDWEKYKRKSHNKPDYNNAFKIVIKRIDKEKLSKTEYKHYDRYGTQGQIIILHKIYDLLFCQEQIKRLIQEKIQIIEDLFKDTHPMIYHEVLTRLYEKEFPPLN
jgi:hypothetical protein